MNRRNWLKSTALVGTGVAMSAASISSSFARTPNMKQHFAIERNPILPEDLPKMKARLLANENPYGPSDATKKAIMEAISTGNRYGHEQAHTLIGMIAELEGVTADHIMLGPGSSDLLEKTAINAFKDGKGNVVSAHPSYMSLMNTAQSVGAAWKSVPLTADKAHDLKGMEAAVDSETRLVYVCNPNNPTGTITDATKLRAFCSRVSEKVPVFVDEAYLEFLPEGRESSMVDLVAKGKDVIIARTFSKIHGMAGLRIGYIVAQPERLEVFQKMYRTTMGLCVTSLMGAIASLKDTEFHEKSRVLTQEGRQFVYQKMKALDLEYIPSHTSFIMFPLDMSGKKFRDMMMEEGVGIRVYDIDDKPWGRVSMGTIDELGLFAMALDKTISASRGQGK